MFGHESKPSRIYSYGCKTPHENADAGWQQIRLAHKYRNRLVEIELDRRRQTDECNSRHFPRLAAVEEEIMRLETDLATVRAQIKGANAKERKLTASVLLRAKAKEISAALKTLREERKEIRTGAFASEHHQCRLSVITATADAIRKEARETCGLYWGNYLPVEQAMGGIRAGAPPRFHRFTGDGKLAVQLQGGMILDDALACTDQRLRIDYEPDRKWSVVSMRIGSEGRNPVWLSLRVRLHRMPPEDSQIKWAYLVTRRVGTKTDWSFQLVVSRDGWMREDASAGGMVGIDLGWRRVPDGVRVASWVGDDGREGELVLPMDDVGRWARAETLRSTRDKNFDIARNLLADWLDEHTPPEWMTERLKLLRAWRSQSRLASVVIHWRDNRFDGDTAIFDAVEAWRKQDKHLLEWESHQRVKAIRWRDNLYRNFAADMRRAYHTVALEDTNWREILRRPSAEDDTENLGAAKEYARIASVGRLATCLRESVTESVKVDAKHTTDTCHACERVDTFDSANEILHTCSHCGATWDQDRNAARNLLRLASAPVLSETP